jgi:RNA polymerase sigma-70 factor (ECF subfamily)
MNAGRASVDTGQGSQAGVAGSTTGGTYRLAPVDDPSTLVRRARNGDGAAFMALLDRHDRSLRTLAYRILGDRGDMDDALQEVALKAFGALPGFRGEASFGTWIHRIAYTTCLNRLRGCGRTVPLEESRDEPGDTQRGDPTDTLLLRVELAAAMSSLTPDQRAVVALVLEDGFDHRTAAAVLDVPMGTVASRLAAARTTLRKLLREPSTLEEGS